MTRLDGKIAIVTGAASGIGRASAIAMAANGASVDVADVNLAGATDVVAELRATGAEALAIKVDVSEADQVEPMVRQTVKRFGGGDLLRRRH